MGSILCGKESNRSRSCKCKPLKEGYDYYDDDDYGECMPFKKRGCKTTLSTLFAQHHRGKLQVIACLGEVEI